jgi:5-methylcytosine-specific restriction endonuclease McrA
MVTCAHCGKTLERGRAHVAAYTLQFCDNTCQWGWRQATGAMHGENHPRYKGGYSGYYGPNWVIQRRAARKRDGYRCCACGKTTKQNGRALDVHHIRPFSSFGYVPGENVAYLEANDLQNLVSLCRKCHQRVEYGRIGFQSALPIHIE